MIISLAFWKMKSISVNLVTPNKMNWVLKEEILSEKPPILHKNYFPYKVPFHLNGE